MIVFYNFSSEAISLQYKWSCKHKKQPLFQKFYLREGGDHRFTKGDFLEVQIVISPLIFEILKNGFQFSLLSLPSFESVKTMLEFVNFKLRVWCDIIHYDIIIWISQSIILSKNLDFCPLSTCHVYIKLC